MLRSRSYVSPPLTNHYGMLRMKQFSLVDSINTFFIFCVIAFQHKKVLTFIGKTDRNIL